MTAKRKPLNLRLVQLTPTWAFKQQARRWMVALFFPIPFLAGVAAGYINSLWSLLFAPLMIIPMMFLVWLIGSTGAQTSSPDECLDEREITVRNKVYLNAFRVLAIGITVVFAVFVFFPASPVVAQIALYLLFSMAWLLPTFILAWTQPDPLEEL